MYSKSSFRVTRCTETRKNERHSWPLPQPAGTWSQIYKPMAIFYRQTTCVICGRPRTRAGGRLRAQLAKDFLTLRQGILRLYRVYDISDCANPRGIAFMEGYRGWAFTVYGTTVATGIYLSRDDRSQ
jgi:hypothetical protein